MHMSLDKEVTQVICTLCKCHAITVVEAEKSLHAGGYNISLLVNSIAWPYSNSIPIVYSDSL